MVRHDAGAFVYFAAKTPPLPHLVDKEM